ncbi:MAG: DUF488 domain-containing protein [Chloroflexota bacterium]|nr:DUF488 domain-containing protein [Chloroflexota bacterium]MDE2960506.1 DUF488 domain-containing protein [Chloroflexota bacterium]
MNQTKPMVLTVGHSNHPPEAFINLLVRHGVDEIIDVRSAPYSRYASQFNHEGIQRMLDDIGIGYAYLGGELGGRPADRSCYDADGRVRYDRVAAIDSFDDALRRVTRVADENRVALLCTEKEPLECHRTLLVARALAERGVDVAHIQGDGSLEDHDDAMSRLLDLHKLPPHGDMFRTRADVIAEALDRQARKFAYVETNLPPVIDGWESAP